MDTSGFGNRQAVIRWGRDLAEAVRQWSGEEAADGIEQAVEEYEAEKFEIAILGKVKRGKSTLINALLGRQDDDVAPVDKLPTSSAITRVGWAREDKAAVVFRDGRREQIGFDRIREYVTEEHNRENRKGVSVVEVEGPFPQLDRGTVLVDTPGAGSLHEHHEALLHGYIPRADAVVFLVTARMPLDQDELELLRQVKEADIRKVFFALNRVDECGQEEIQQAIDHNREVLAEVGVEVKKIHRISAKQAMQGEAGESGVDELLAEMAGFLAENKGRMLAEKLEGRVRALAEPVYRSLELELASLDMSADDLATELRKLQAKKRRVESDRELAEREFKHTWSRALDEFGQSIRQAERRVAAAAERKVSETSVAGVSSLSKSLPTWLERQIEKELRPATEKFEAAAREAGKKLEDDYPSIGMDNSHSIVIRTRAGTETLVRCGAGAAVAGVGGSIVAGSSIAVASAGTTTVAAPSAATGIASWLGLESLAAATTGTATVGAAAPAWAVFAGPVGWTVAGVGLLAIPFAWGISKVKLREKLQDATREQVEQVFRHLRDERLPALHKTAEAMVDDYRLRLERELKRIETTLAEARDRSPDDAHVGRLKAAVTLFRQMLGQRQAERVAGPPAAVR